MRLQDNDKERIKNYILEKIYENDKQYAKKASAAFDVSLQTVYKYVRDLEQNKIITKVDKTYKLVEELKYFGYTDGIDKLEEDRIYRKEIEGILSDLSNNVRQIWGYTFTEMMNNAIEHSEASKIYGYVIKNYLNTVIVIIDDGVGIFEKIKNYFDYEDLEEAMANLFLGKLTTDSSCHSGEGIYFTSRSLDCFVALSSGKIFTHNNHFEVIEDLKNIQCMEQWEKDKGTKIVMTLSNFTNKTILEVFDMYSNQEEGFIKTHVPVNIVCENGYPVSRSQARRMSTRFSEFKEVILDFENVEQIGQGFAHELFVVFQNNNPDVILKIEKCNAQVDRMIKHVLAS